MPRDTKTGEQIWHDAINADREMIRGYLGGRARESFVEACGMLGHPTVPDGLDYEPGDPDAAMRLILRNQLAIMAAEQSHHLPCEAVWRYLEAAMTETDEALGERPLADHEDEDASDDVS